MKLSTSLFGKTYQFRDIKEVLAKANEEKSGDILAGIAAGNTAERVAAKVVLAGLTLEDLRNNPVVPPEEDEVTRIIDAMVDEAAYQTIKAYTVGDFRDFILRAPEEELCLVRAGLTGEMVAAVTKLMGNLDLIYAAKKLPITACCNTVIGETGVLASRLQPNHPTDDIAGIMASLKEGLSYGVGDAVIGVNPVEDSIAGVSRVLSALKEFIDRWRIPTQNCVLAHVTTQMEVARRGVPIDLMFQSLAGTELSNTAFGINIPLLDEAYQVMKDSKSSRGENFMYFETGQGSELSSDGHHRADQVTLEARCYGVAKRYKPFLVNTVVGFIGPEYLYDGRQVIRAGLEDHFMGKLTGLPMGVDVCYTNHMKADQNDMDNLLVLLAAADCAYFMGVPATDDIMLMYQSTSYHDIAAARQIAAKRPIREFEQWLELQGIMRDGKLTPIAGDPSLFGV
jgi:ethanolamine ammonia-lyase large subunit